MVEDIIFEDCAGFKNQLMDRYVIINIKIARLESMLKYPANLKRNVWYLDREIRPFLIEFVNLANFNMEFSKETKKACALYFKKPVTKSPTTQRQNLIVEHGISTIQFWKYLSNAIRNLKIIALTGE